MGASLRWKVYNADGGYITSFKDVSAAAQFISQKEDGSTIREGRRVRDIVWTKGSDGYPGESFDHVAEFIYRKLGEIWQAKRI